MKAFVMGAAGTLAMLVMVAGIAWASDILTVDKDGTVRLVVTDSGKVGIGTASPTTSLNVLQTANDGTDGILAQAAAPGGQVILYHAGNGTGRLRIGTTDAMMLTNTGRCVVGATAITAGAKLEIAGTDGAILIPRMTTAERDALTAANGMIIYNATTNQFNFRENGAWALK